MATTHLEFPFLEEVYTPPGSPLIDFVFVHGLNPRARNEHAFETWTHENRTCWPRDYLPQDIPNSRVFIYGYNSTVTDARTMSTASIKDHANTLLNLLDMERSEQMGVRAPKIIWVGHSLGGLVIKQALLNAHEDRKYTSIRTDTCGLVFFGTPHRGAKGVELGKIAANVAKFISKGHAKNDLLQCLEENSFFTKQMSSRFSHQLEDYQVVSFVEGKEVFIAGAGPASISHLVVDEDSAILGLPGSRETRLKLDADHSQMCKVGSRGAMYKLIKGNIKQIADQVLLAERGFVPRPSPSPNPGPPLPPRMHLNSSMPYPGPPRTPDPNETRVIGSLFHPADNDPRSIQVAKYMNDWKWDDARRVQYALFQEHHRSLGQDHYSTLLAGYYLADIELAAGYLIKAREWCEWVCNNSQRVLGKRHELALKSESMMGELLCRQGKSQEGESVCANVLARQQMTIGDDHLDTLETRRRLATTYNNVGRHAEAIEAMTKYSESVGHLLGQNHILYLSSVLDITEQVLAERLNSTEKLILRHFTGVDSQAEAVEAIVKELNTRLGPHHPLTIRGMWMNGAMNALDPENSAGASEALRRALATAEEYLGPEHSETMNIVGVIGMMYALRGSITSYGYNPYLQDKSANLTLALPWLERSLRWTESRQGLGSPDLRTILDLVAKMYFGSQKFREAQPFFERLISSYRAANMPVPDEVQSCYQLTRLNTRFLTPGGVGGGTGGGTDLMSLISSFKRM
ncbi:LipA and NB-ARC domain protein [Aspergillus lucknowensis]|uniref:Lipa and NB-ARC domain protein n=1 Tax=Aspergillus lucknowensis TaxID=176173 RepID=A0ABR4LMI2_9EURO